MEEDEARIKDFLIKASKIGYGVSQNELPGIVKNFLDKKEKYFIETNNLGEEEKAEIISQRKFLNNEPSKYWVYGYVPSAMY